MQDANCAVCRKKSAIWRSFTKLWAELLMVFLFSFHCRQRLLIELQQKQKTIAKDFNEKFVKDLLTSVQFESPQKAFPMKWLYTGFITAKCSLCCWRLASFVDLLTAIRWESLHNAIFHFHLMLMFRQRLQAIYIKDVERSRVDLSVFSSGYERINLTTANIPLITSYNSHACFLLIKILTTKLKRELRRRFRQECQSK